MNPNSNPNRYWRQGAVAASDVNTTLAPTAVCASADELIAAIEARLVAEETWTTERASADASDSVVKRAAAARDTAGKAAAALAQRHAHTIVEYADEWLATLDDALLQKVEELERLVGAVEAALLTVNELRSVRMIPLQTTEKVLERYRLRHFTGHARDGVSELKQWLSPPASRQAPVRALNFGRNLMGPRALDFVGREE